MHNKLYLIYISPVKFFNDEILNIYLHKIKNLNTLK
jgi:hypothetical protein